MNSKTYSILKEEVNTFKSENCYFKTHKFSFPNESNPMHGKTMHDVWVEKYGIDEANKLQKEFKRTQSKNTSGSSNPMYGRNRKGEVQNYNPEKFKRIRKVCCLICKKEVTQNSLLQHQKGKYCRPILDIDSFFQD